MELTRGGIGQPDLGFADPWIWPPGDRGFPKNWDTYCKLKYGISNMLQLRAGQWRAEQMKKKVPTTPAVSRSRGYFFFQMSHGSVTPISLIASKGILERV
jgi:hypothetical protein